MDDHIHVNVVTPDTESSEPSLTPTEASFDTGLETEDVSLVACSVEDCESHCFLQRGEGFTFTTEAAGIETDLKCIEASPAYTDPIVQLKPRGRV